MRKYHLILLLNVIYKKIDILSICNIIYLQHIIDMGRYYHGDISGKFVFAKQNSDIYNYFKEGIEFYSWTECGCYYFDPKQKYCRECADSYKKYKEEYPDHKYTKNRDASGLHYYLTVNDLEHINERLQELELQLGGTNYVNNIVNDIDLSFDESCSYEIDYSYTKFESHIPYNDNKYDDKWDLYFNGLQLKKCLEINNVCNFYADYY